jgi:hypothetical protein
MEPQEFFDHYQGEDLQAILILVIVYSHTLARMHEEGCSVDLLERLENFHEGLTCNKLNTPHAVIQSINSNPIYWLNQSVNLIDSIFQ